MSRRNPTPSEIHTGGAIENVSLGAAGSVNLFFSAETIPEGFQHLGEDAAAGAAVALFGLAVRAGLGRGHMSKFVMEWGLPTIAGTAATVNDMVDRGAWNTLGDLTIGASRFGTAFFMGRALANAWLHDAPSKG